MNGGIDKRRHAVEKEKGDGHRPVFPVVRIERKGCERQDEDLELTTTPQQHPSAAPRPWHTLPVEEVLAVLGCLPEHGLSQSDAKTRLHESGPNELVERQGRRPLSIVWDQISSTLVLILIAAAVVSALLGKITETLAIGAIVILFAALGFVQEYRAERAMAALKKIARPMVRVRREGQTREIPAHEMVPGDVVLLEAGSVVPADVRIIESANLRIQESALTGESVAVEKVTGPLETQDLPLGDRVNMGFMGTAVTYGRGTAVTVATGMATELGRIADLIQDVPTSMTPLQRRLDRVGKWLALFGVAVALLVLFIGYFQGAPLSLMFLTAVSVAVAVVPEGLPAVVTVTLALGAQRMLRRKALIRRLPAVETLGSVTVICSDKTGTLTENRMTVTVIDVAGHYLDLVGTVRHPAPGLKGKKSERGFLESQPQAIAMVLAAGTLCNDADFTENGPDGMLDVMGDPTEGALLVAAAQAGLQPGTIKNGLDRVAELPFDSERKRMTTMHLLPPNIERIDPLLAPLHGSGQAYLSITKGAVDGMIEICDRLWYQGETIPLGAEWRERLQQANEHMAGNGMRVLGFAMRWWNDPGELEERDLIFLGLSGMIDPPRPEVKRAVNTCLKAGIRPVMITGDHPLTARFIAHDLGISLDGRVATGQELSRMNPEQLQAVVGDISVYARVSPENKLRIVEALQNNGQIAAMTGDGVNDSPALRKADIGIAMGITGTDVSKEASDMVLLDDNFATIVAAVEEGRVIYDNVRRFVKFSIAGNLGKIAVMLLAPLFGIVIALLPLQLLWLNLLTDGLLGLGLGVEPSGPGIMDRPPRSPKESFFGRRMGWHVAWVGGTIGVLALGIGLLYHDPAAPDDMKWQTMIFTSLAFLQIGQALASRSSHASLLSVGLFSNRPLLLLVLLTIGLQLMVLFVPFFHSFFGITPLNSADLFICTGLGLLLLLAIESEKLLVRAGRRRGQAQNPKGPI
jgi:P-type Ca2+ transporter type 2C